MKGEKGKGKGKGKDKIQQHTRLYPTQKEERDYRELKERYGFRDALVVNGVAGKKTDKAQRLKQS